MVLTDRTVMDESQIDQQQSCWVSNLYNEQLRHYQLDNPVVDKILKLLENESTKSLYLWNLVTSKRTGQFGNNWV